LSTASCLQLQSPNNSEIGIVFHKSFDTQTWLYLISSGNENLICIDVKLLLIIIYSPECE
jgi:hypothetical protein